MSRIPNRVSLLALSLALTAGAPFAAAAQTTTPAPATTQAAGTAGTAQAMPAQQWSKPAVAPAGAPNIVLIMLDDVGFGDTGTFGGPESTPVLDALAAGGARYNRFHTTALCSPSRAALLTGRNAHEVGYGSVGELGYPGYDGIWGKDTVSVAEVLRRNGYGTALFGKWHNTPFREISPAGPFDHWPTSLGFEHFYGNMLGAASQWTPLLWNDTQMVAQPKSQAEGYHFTTDITDRSIEWVRTRRTLNPDKPYFLYFAPLAAHMPHDVPAEWIARYKGRFDGGWDKLREETFARQKALGVIPKDARLTPRPAELPAWDSLPEKQRLVLASQMEAYAAFISHTDHEIGRLLEAVRAQPGGDNTIVIYIVGDNGSAGEMDTQRAVTMAALQPRQKDAFYAAGWAWAGSTPFQWSKGVASHLGGTRNPMVVSWPGHIRDRGVIRTQFTHLNDIAATLYDIAGITMPATVDGVAQKPLEGASFADTFANARAPSHHRRQYFEVWGNRAIYQDGWMASARHGVPWQMKGASDPLDPPEAFAADRWELYDLDHDFSQSQDLAAREPQRLAAMKTLFDAEARRNQVYPLISNNMYGAYPPAHVPTSMTFPGGMPTILALAAPDFGGRSFAIDADVVVPANGAQGVLFSHGGAFSLYVDKGQVAAEGLPLLGTKVLRAPVALSPGRHRIGYRFTINPGPKPGAYMPAAGKAMLTIDGKAVDQGKMGIIYSSMQEIDIGRDTAAPASRTYVAPFPFTGTIDTVRLDTAP
ncbi:arylsulfatase [Sphingomonas sp. RP10(2022)]|uniref:Arylsulfatase n=1 Tax=Sphingomonas liriopis TaxID=2949094 RepID=A0A9X2HNN2_9SPHN|nr:arylsulfatase [Sphingomonas liriopis]MCP3733532.1 arylsulfatase [Sphingomonas liriopis]